MATEIDCSFSECSDPIQVFNQTEFEAKVHPFYDNSTYKNDIALIKLNRPVTLSKSVSPVCLPFNEPDLPERMELIRFKLAQDSQSRKVEKVIIKTRDCEHVSGNQFCADDDKKRRFYKGVFTPECDGKVFSPTI